MRNLAKIMARRLPIVRDLLNPRDAPIEEPDIAVVSNGPEPTAPAPNQYPWGGARTETATRDDIFYCFRLLLGRNPNPEEWPGHSSRAGEDLENVVSSYVTSREFAARGLLNKTYRDQVELVRFPAFSIFVSRDDLAIGHHVASDYPYEPGISAVFERYVKPGMAAADIAQISGV